MYERFTDEARQVIVLAQQEARALRHGFIGTEHILLGLLRQQQGLAGRVLQSLGLSVERVRGEVVQIAGYGVEHNAAGVPFTPRAKKVLELALREALSVGDNYIATDHILLGLVREKTGVAARILLDADVDADAVRSRIIGMLSAPHVRSAQGAKRAPQPRGSSAPRTAEGGQTDIPELGSLSAEDVEKLIVRLRDEEQVAFDEVLVLRAKIDALRTELERLRRGGREPNS